jgi:hypothetical protein
MTAQEAQATLGHAALRCFAPWFSRFSRRILVFALVAAAILISGTWLVAPTPQYGTGDPQVVSAAGCFQSLISSVLWFTGLCLAVSGGLRYRRATKTPQNDIAYDWLESSAERRLLAAALMILFPFVQNAMQQSTYELYSEVALFDWLAVGFFIAGACRFRSAARFPENSARRIWRRNRGLAYITLFNACIYFPFFHEIWPPMVAWYYFAFMAFLIADVNLRHAQRLKDDRVSAAVPKMHAAGWFTAGFAFLAAPTSFAVLPGF